MDIYINVIFTDAFSASFCPTPGTESAIHMTGVKEGNLCFDFMITCHEIRPNSLLISESTHDKDGIE